jgi:hypothetical protein
MFLRKFVFLCTLLLCFASAGFSQSLADPTIIPLTVDKGISLQVSLTDKLSFKENESVKATIVEPVYSFDREVIPSGAQLEGAIIGWEKPGKWKRISAMLGGDFTSLREPRITFHTLVLPDGTRTPIETFVIPGTDKVVGSENKHAGGLKNSLAATAKNSGRDTIKHALLGLAPFHGQSIPAGTRLSAVLSEPLDFGVAVFEKEALAEIGSEPPADTIASIRLVTPLNSRSTTAGTPVEAQLNRPLFSADHRLIFPVGSKLRGSVAEVKAAHGLHHNGQLVFNLTTIEPPDLLNSSTRYPRQIQANFLSVQVAHEMKDLRVNENGSARIVESKKRFIGPAWAFIRADRALGSSADPFGKALLGAYQGKFLKQFTGGEPGFGLPASISGAMVPPIGIALGFYGAARSVYRNFLGRGRDISLPANTPMEIRLGMAVPTLREEEQLQQRQK